MNPGFSQKIARRKTLLIVLGALLLAAAWRSLQPLLRDEETVAPAAAVLPAGHQGPRPGDRLAALNLAGLDRNPSGSTGGRDLWRFLDPPAPRQAETVLVHTELPALPSQSQPPGPVVPAAPALPELNLEYLGNFGPPQHKIAVFSNGKEIYNAREGDVIDGRFIVARIGHESVDVRLEDSPDAPLKRVGVRRR